MICQMTNRGNFFEKKSHFASRERGSEFPKKKKKKKKKKMLVDKKESWTTSSQVYCNRYFIFEKLFHFHSHFREIHKIVHPYRLLL